MRAAFFNPYLDTLGGGEKYTLLFAKAVYELGYSVDLQWNSSQIINKLSSRFGENFDFVSIVNDIRRGDGYDLCFWVSDGSIPILKSRNNILHFQVPFRNVNGKTLLNKMKLFRIRSVVCNSQFTKSFIDLEYGLDSQVIYPPVNTRLLRPLQKENIILYIGRFSELLQSKRQDVLIDSFKKMLVRGIKKWKLIIAGGSDVGNGGLLENLRKKSQGYPIEVWENLPYRILNKYFIKSKIFWSAAGFGIDENREPEKMEHFGLTIIEAMNCGCVPVVYNGGGHKEIVCDGGDGYLWKTEKELIGKTISLIKDKIDFMNFSKAAYSKSISFGYDEFKNRICEVVNY